MIGLAIIEAMRSQDVRYGRKKTKKKVVSKLIQRISTKWSEIRKIKLSDKQSNWGLSIDGR